MDFSCPLIWSAFVFLPISAWSVHGIYSCVCMTLSLFRHIAHQALFSSFDFHFDIFLFIFFLELFQTLRRLRFSLLLYFTIRLNSPCSGRSSVVMGWPAVPCFCFRAPTTYRHPNLEGEQVEQQTTALHQSLWR